MSDYILASPIVAPGPVTATHSTPQAPIGIEVDAIDRSGATSAGAAAGRFVYARGSNVGTVGAWVELRNGSAVMLTAPSSAYPIGVAAGLLSATNVYGWVQVQGNCDFARGTNSAIAVGVPLYAVGTAGVVGSAVGAGSRIQGAVCPVSYTSAQSLSMTVYLNRPFIAGATAAL